VLMGSLTVNTNELYDKLYFISKTIGACPSPFDCYLALRGLKTLKIRMDASCQNAIKIAEYLDKHEKVEKVVYMSLKHHPSYAIAKKQMKLPGAMITFYIKGKKE